MNKTEPTFNPEIWKDEYFNEELAEHCPHCDEEVEVFHSILKQGFKYICPNCGMSDHFCSLCTHAEDNPEHYCDWVQETGECWRDRQWRKFHNAKRKAEDITIDEMMDRDIYYVEINHEGKKVINVQRYYYDEENINIVEYCGVRLNIPCTRNEFEDAIMSSKQYSGPVSLDRAEAMKELENELFGLKRLCVDDVDENTPLGKYIDLIDR